mmetsp:Transcript_75927/g.234364  ORF Transcript_75927/g.234364 Transcript_75927/m.234364 type:complete len:334 (-) Transcript_75927:221-1222(-)
MSTKTPNWPTLVTVPETSMPTSSSSRLLACGCSHLPSAAAFALALALLWALAAAAFALRSGVALGFSLASLPLPVASLAAFALAVVPGSCWAAPARAAARAAGGARSGSSSNGSLRERRTLSPVLSRPSTLMPKTSSSGWNCFMMLRGSCSRPSVTAPMSTRTPLRPMPVTVPLTAEPVRKRASGKPSGCSLFTCSALGFALGFGFGDAFAAAGAVSLAAAGADAARFAAVAGRTRTGGCSSSSSSSSSPSPSPSTDNSGSSNETVICFFSRSTTSIFMPYTSSPFLNFGRRLLGTRSLASFSQPMLTKSPYWFLLAMMPSHWDPSMRSSMGV